MSPQSLFSRTLGPIVVRKFESIMQAVNSSRFLEVTPLQQRLGWLLVLCFSSLFVLNCGGGGGGGNNGGGTTLPPPPTPTISGVSPSSAAAGTTVTISGSNFGASQGSSTVTFNGTSAGTSSAWNANSITIKVPTGATTGNIVVTVSGAASNGTAFTVAPAISALSANSGKAGTALTITGLNFGASQGNSTVTFNGVPAGAASTWSTTSITVTIPNTGTTGNIVVTVAGLASNGSPFTVGPVITSLSSSSGTPGTALTITGLNFGATQGSSTITFNGVAAGSASTWSASSITVNIPNGATTGNIVVTSGGLASNGAPFTISASSSNTVTGTASAGAPLANAAVTLKDVNGNISTGTTASDGTFTLNTGGLTPPFLVKVVTASGSGSFPAGSLLYSVSADSNATTAINVHVLSDLIVRSWYSVQGINPDVAFTNPVASPAPSPQTVQIIAGTVIQLMQLWLNNAGVNATAGTPSNGSINLISSPFTANDTGLDAVLHIMAEALNASNGSISAITVSNGTITETANPTYANGTIAVNTTTTDSTSGAVTTGSLSVIPPTSNAQQNAINAIAAQVAALVQVINAKGNALTGSDLLPFYASDYLNDGANAANAAASFAGNVAGLTITSAQIGSIKSLDTTNNTADIVVTAIVTAGGQTQSGTTEFILKEEGGVWLIYGDQRITQISVAAQSRTAQGAPSLGPGVSHGTYIFTSVEAPHGVVTGATVSGGGNIWNGAASGALNQEASISQNGQALDDFLLLSQSLGSNISELPSAGTPFTFNLTTTSSGSPQYTVTSNNFTTEAISFKGLPNVGSLTSVVGKTLSYNWLLPTTFAIAQVDLFAYIYDGPATSSTTHSCSVDAGNLLATATSATIAIPADMSVCGLSGTAIQQVNVFLDVSGIDGEDALVALVYPYNLNPVPVISNLNPTSGLVGTSVTITGSNFGVTQGSSVVTFHGVSAGTATAWSVTSITMNVPAGATTGNVVVHAGGQASNGVLFTVTTPPPPDFSISVSPASVSTQMGTTSAPVTISVSALNGFSGSVAVGVNGLPAGVTCSPSCSPTINLGSAAQVSFVVPANASIGNVALTVQGTSGSLNHSVPLTLGMTSSLQGFWNLWTGTAVPQGNPATLSGHIFVSGWGFETIAINTLTVFVDNIAVGNAFYGLARPDVKQGIPSAPLYSGFSLGVDTTKLSNGTHTISVQVTDAANNVTLMQNYPNGPLTAIQVNINNPTPVPSSPVVNLTLNAATTSLVAGTVVGFTAQATDGSGQPVSPSFAWMSSDPSIAKVTPTGVVFPLSPGSATISVSAGGVTKQLPVSVQAGSGTPGTIQVSLGPEEAVFQYKRDGCVEGDIPDGGARAVRLSDGSILLIAGDAPFNFADVGADFWSLKRRCEPTLVSADNPAASAFQYWEWIYGLYNDGTSIHALVHNEFHDPTPPNCQPVNSSLCQYDSVTYAASTDGGHTFQMAAAPQNVVAPPTVQWTPPAPGTTQPVYGSQEPTNIVHAADGYYYARFGVFPPPGQPYFGRMCVMRTQTLSDPASWRAWDGTAFELQMTDPYVGPAAGLCADTSTNGTSPYESLTFNTYLDVYMALGLDSDFSNGTPVNCGFHFALSSDVVHWTQQQLIAPAYVPEPTQCEAPGAGGLAGSFAYASIIDPDDPSRSFETPGRTAYIYYTRFNDNSEDRDLVRVPVMFTKY